MSQFCGSCLGFAFGARKITAEESYIVRVFFCCAPQAGTRATRKINLGEKNE